MLCSRITTTDNSSAFPDLLLLLQIFRIPVAKQIIEDWPAHKGGVTITTESRTDAATTLSRMKFIWIRTGHVKVKP